MDAMNVIFQYFRWLLLLLKCNPHWSLKHSLGHRWLVVVSMKHDSLFT